MPTLHTLCHDCYYLLRGQFICVWCVLCRVLQMTTVQALLVIARW